MITKVEQLESIEILCPKYLGAPYPPFNPKAINESQIPHNMRFKDAEIWAGGYDGVLYINWCTQQGFSPADYRQFKKEIKRCIQVHLTDLQNTPDALTEVTVDVHVYARFGEGNTHGHFKVKAL